MSVRWTELRGFPWRAAAPSLAVSGVLLSLTLCGAVALSLSQRRADEALDTADRATLASMQVDDAIRQFWDVLYSYVLPERSLQRVTREDIHAETIRCFAALDALAQAVPVQRRVEDLKEVLLDLENPPEILLVLPALERFRTLEAMKDKRTNDRQLQLRSETQAWLAVTRADSRAMTLWTGWGLLLLGVIGALAGTLAGFSLARGLRRQLVQLTIPVRTAEGSLSEVIGPLAFAPLDQSVDEVSDLQPSLDALAGRVADVVSRLQAAERESLRQDQLAALGQLAAGLAHELRNPLTAIKTLVEASRENEVPLDERDLEVLDEEITRLDATLQTFLDYARPPRLERRPIDLRDVVQRTLQLVAGRAERQSIRVAARLPAEPVTVDADPEQLRQVLLNLALNAFDAIGHSGEVDVTLQSAHAGAPVRLEVADTGPGICDSVRQRLFEPFVSSKAAGTGLGLTISRRIVENHGGSIDAGSRPGGGAVFTITLPAQAS